MKRIRLVVAIAVAVIALPSATADDLDCAIGWGKGTHKVTKEQMNDGYCDCPLDGADEPNTNACSGSMVGSFTGIPAVSLQGQKYQCPQQKKLQIPYSRFQDGICDCCDGSDELPNACPDICDQVLAQERALREKMAREFSLGYELRQKQIADFQTTLKEAEAKKKGVDEELEGVEEKLSDVESKLDQVKHEYMQQRVNRAGDIANRVATSGTTTNDSLTGLLESLSNDEIADLIVHSCQMAGEMEISAELDGSTCVPLRLAGLDAALMWSRENSGTASLNRLHMNVREEGKKLADKLIVNARKDHVKDKEIFDGGQKQTKKHRNKKTKRSKPGRRRLQEVSSDDEDEMTDDHFDYLDSDEYGNDEYGNDEDEQVDEVDDGEAAESDDTSNSEENVETGILEKLKESLFSQPRVAFLQRSQEIVDGIDALLKGDDDDDKEKKDGEQKEEKTDESSSKDAIDSDAYNMVKSTLEGREEAIGRGYDCAVSAKILLKALTESTQDQDLLQKDLRALAVGTLLYGGLSVVHAWQIFQAILPEFNQDSGDQGNKEKTCATSPWGASCPPVAIKRMSVSFPPQQVLQAAQVLCTTPTFTQEKAQACAADADNELPTVMPDGYYGYEAVQPREENDPLNVIAVEWDAPLDESFQKRLDELEDKKDKLKEEQKKIEDSIQEINDLVEGAKESRYGRDGELYALKDQCFSIKAGKYTYEGCPFGNAAQKEGDAKKSGTGLGQWEGASYDEETGNRILKWTNGVKCWNGPKRSATAIVTCGAETKVLLADEPDTCRYVLHMESHIACDDDFKRIHEL